MKQSLILLLTLLFITSLLAQNNPQPHFRNYGTEDGLPSPEVYCVMEDSKGYMWFGTDNGAARFDGYTFKTYGATEGLLNNVVLEIKEDVKGRIWFSTMLGEVYIYDKNKIEPYSFNETILKYKNQYRTAELKAVDEKGNAWFEAERLGVLKIDSLGKAMVFTSKKPYSFFLFKESINVPTIFVSVSKQRYARFFNKY